MSTHEKTIQTIARSKSKLFKWLRDRMVEACPEKPEWWCLGVAVHIKCQCDSKGSLEYQIAKWEHTWPIVLSKRSLDKKAIATIREKTIKDKYERYIAYANN